MSLRFAEFVRLGSDQAAMQRNPLAAAFFRWIGPLGVHARIRNARVIGAVSDLDLADKRVLDIGCGYGYSLFWLARRWPTARLAGVDVNQTQIEACNRAARAAGLRNLSFRAAQLAELQGESEYDLLISIDTLEHVEDDADMLRRMAALLRPGGRLVLHVPLRHQLQRRVFPQFGRHTVEDHVRDEYLPEEIAARVRGAGLRVCRIAYGFGFLGELAFELNNLFWQRRAARNLTALATLPISLAAGYVDARQDLVFGNSILVVAVRE